MAQILYTSLVVGGCLLGVGLLVILIVVGFGVWLGGSEPKTMRRRD